MKITEEVLSRGKWLKNNIFRWEPLEGKRIYLKKVKCLNCDCDCFVRVQSIGKYCTLECKNEGGINNLSSMRFGRLIVLKRTTKKGNYWHWLCKCDCGNETEVRGSHLTSKKKGIKSCGCLAREVSRENQRKSFTKRANQLGYADYDTFAERLKSGGEEVRRNKDIPEILEVRCKYCNKFIMPIPLQVYHRCSYIEGTSKNESNFYCVGDECKKSCSIFYQSKYPKGFKKSKDLTREVQPELRDMVLERDGYQCLKCKSTEELHCHHIEGILYNPIESADIDLCMTVCKPCHVEIHHEDGCTYYDLQCHEVSQ